MHVTFAPKGNLQIDDCRIIYKNFSGVGSKFNREGDRNFAVLIDDEEIKDALVDEGWNVKIKPPRDEDDSPFMYLPVKIKFNDFGPNVYLVTGNTQNRLEEEDMSILDEVDILNVNLDIRPYDWSVNGKEGRTAYLRNLQVIQQIDRFAERFMNENRFE